MIEGQLSLVFSLLVSLARRCHWWQKSRRCRGTGAAAFSLYRSGTPALSHSPSFPLSLAFSFLSPFMAAARAPCRRMDSTLDYRLST
jgi:hypothetical protein